MQDDWLFSLLTLSCGSDILKKAQNKETVKKFTISTVYKEKTVIF